MIIVNGKTKTVVVFGDVSPQAFQLFMGQMSMAISKWHSEGCPASGDFA
ncbi:hypothetical protein vBRpoPV13_11 [Ruegeria phage vB_RpoP-V13]|uniref:Uncharacterized protein n=1 Tax=Ruegeria phage vB_RpoP-V13 TaxID=2218612 RepID=A0A2Z4QGK4_9CAUD|nr:hypothetical protein HYP63_gp11 [Ruegeria phage vB_RpoP-V13]AWY09368.1 hypothetical protein vBRpoPV13_11 [Ruegeria phage vB_RpoP-V13]